MKISNKENINIENKQIDLLQNFIKTWTKNLHYCIKKDQQQKNRYIVEFSKVNQQKPIPNISLKVYFLMKDNSENLQGLQFRFQDEQLVHTLGSSIKYQDVESYIEKQFENIEKVRQMYFLATHFERTRIIDPRIEQLQEVIEVKQRQKEILSISNEQYLKKEKRIQLKNEDQIANQNTRILKNCCMSLLKELDQNFLGFKNSQELKNFVELLGVDISNFSDFEYYIYGDQQLVNGIVNLELFQDKFAQILLSKLIFQKSLQRYQNTVERYKQESQRLFFYKFKFCLQKFRQFMVSLEQQQQLSFPNLKLNISKIQEKILTQEEYKIIMSKVEKINIFEKKTIQQIIQIICQSKEEGFLKQTFDKNYNQFEDRLLQHFDQQNRPLLRQEFLDLFQKCEFLKMPTKQIEILWELLKSNDLVENQSFNFKKYITVLSYYFKHLILLSPSLEQKEEFDISYIKFFDQNDDKNIQKDHNTNLKEGNTKIIQQNKKYVYINEDLKRYLNCENNKKFEKEQLKIKNRIKQINELLENLIQNYIIVNQLVQVYINQKDDKFLSISENFEFKNY